MTKPCVLVSQLEGKGCNIVWGCCCCMSEGTSSSSIWQRTVCQSRLLRCSPL